MNIGYRKMEKFDIGTPLIILKDKFIIGRLMGMTDSILLEFH